MASSGTVAAPVIEMCFKPGRGREEVMIMGHAVIKHEGVIEAGDLTLRTIKSVVVTPVTTRVKAFGGPVQTYGSVNAPGSLMNSVTLATFMGSSKYGAYLGYGTQCRVGTIVGGTQKLNFMIAGA